MTLEDTSRLLIALACCDWILTAVMYVFARRLREPALSERFVVSIIGSVVGTVFAVLGANVLGAIYLDRSVGLWLLSAAAVLVSVPQFVWAIGLAAGKFK